MTNVALHVTAAPQFTPVYGGGLPLANGFNKRQDLTFFSCGFECYPGDFCQGYQSSFGVCCGTTVLTRAQYNYCAPATACVDYSVSSFSTYSFDSTRSVQYCGSALPNCATYIWTKDSFTNIFCADTVSGVYTYDTTGSVTGQSATFVTTGRGGDETTSSSPRTTPTASVIQNTRTSSSESPSSTPTIGGGAPDPAQTSTTNDNGSSLSTGATAGIAVGAAIGGIGLAIGAFFIWRRRGKKTTPTGTDNQFPPQPPMTQPPFNQPGQYPPQSPYSPGPQGVVPGPNNEYYNKYPAQPPANQPVYYELGGGDANTPLMAQLPDGNAPNKGVPQAAPYQENMAPNAASQNRQELQG